LKSVDDSHLFLPLASPNEIEALSVEIGKKSFTKEGCKNTYAGFSHYILSLAEVLEKDPLKINALLDSLISFVKLDLILSNRLYKNDDKFPRLNEKDYEGKAFGNSESITTGQRQQQLRNLVLSIGKAYGKNWDFLYEEKVNSDEHVRRFEKEIGDALQTDNGEKALVVISGAKEKSKKSLINRQGLAPIQTSPDQMKSVLVESTETAWKKLKSTFESKASFVFGDAFNDKNLGKVWKRMQVQKKHFLLI